MSLGDNMSAEAIEERAAYYETWAADIRRLNGLSVDADHADQTARVLRALQGKANEARAQITARDKIIDALRAQHAEAAKEWEHDREAYIRDVTAMAEALGVDWDAPQAMIADYHIKRRKEESQLREAQSAAARLREALEPFARVADVLDFWDSSAMPGDAGGDLDWPEPQVVGLDGDPNPRCRVNTGDYYRARAALSSETGADTK